MIKISLLFCFAWILAIGCDHGSEFKGSLTTSDELTIQDEDYTPVDSPAMVAGAFLVAEVDNSINAPEGTSTILARFENVNRQWVRLDPLLVEFNVHDKILEFYEIKNEKYQYAISVQNSTGNLILSARVKGLVTSSDTALATEISFPTTGPTTLRLASNIGLGDHIGASVYSSANCPKDKEYFISTDNPELATIRQFPFEKTGSKSIVSINLDGICSQHSSFSTVNLADANGNILETALIKKASSFSFSTNQSYHTGKYLVIIKAGKTLLGDRDNFFIDNLSVRFQP